MRLSKEALSIPAKRVLGRKLIVLRWILTNYLPITSFCELSCADGLKVHAYINISTHRSMICDC